MTADLDEIRSHWENWAKSFGGDLRATTRTPTIKELEVDSLARALGAIREQACKPLSILEAGCGNGYNCLRLSQAFPDCRFTGFDYVADMVTAARALRKEAGIPDERLNLFQDDILQLVHVIGTFDVIFTVRCLINLNTDRLQLDAMSALAERVAPGGRLLMIENSRQTHGRQNRARELVGLPPRQPAEFNHFFDDPLVLSHLHALGFDVGIENFSSLHDLILYVLVPMTNGGELDYRHPLVEAATKLSLAMNGEMPGAVGTFGQNQLYYCSKRS